MIKGVSFVEIDTRYETIISPKNPYSIHQLVGFHEYSNALQNFDLLLSKASQAELEAMDRLLRHYDEYAVYTNLARRVEPQATSLREVALKQGDTFKREGLSWMMALARVEVAAMLAGFTATDQPFEAVRPTAFEKLAYSELLFDGMKMHYWALANDPAYVRIRSEATPTSETLTYARRLKVARRFLEATAKNAAGRLSPRQLAELKQWDAELNQHHQGIVAKIQRFLNSTTGVKTGYSSQFLQVCGDFCAEALAKINENR